MWEKPFFSLLEGNKSRSIVRNSLSLSFSIMHAACCTLIADGENPRFLSTRFEVGGKFGRIWTGTNRLLLLLGAMSKNRNLFDVETAMTTTAFQDVSCDLEVRWAQCNSMDEGRKFLMGRHQDKRTKIIVFWVFFLSFLWEKWPEKRDLKEEDAFLHLLLHRCRRIQSIAAAAAGSSLSGYIYRATHLS